MKPIDEGHYLVFAYDNYYPLGARGDIRYVVKCFDEAEKVAVSLSTEWDNVDVYHVENDSWFYMSKKLVKEMV